MLFISTFVLYIRFFALIFLLFLAKNLVIKLCGTIICIITMDNLISVSSMFTSKV